MTTETKPSWIKIKPAELEKIIINLHKEGLTPAQMGTQLRDKHSIPKAKLLGKRICEILKENKLETNQEEKIFEKKIDKLKSHIEKNKGDYPAQRALTKNLWAIKSLKN